MGFLKNLFGNNKKATNLHDVDLGNFTFLANNGNAIIWKGEAKFIGEVGSIYISGDLLQLNSPEKNSLLKILKNESNVNNEIDEALLEQFQEADKEYSKWKDHFKF